MCEGLSTEETWMFEQSETSQLQLFLTDDGNGTDNASFFIVPVVLCLPSML